MEWMDTTVSAAPGPRFSIPDRSAQVNRSGLEDRPADRVSHPLIVQDEGAVRHYCPNLACPTRVAQEFQHFVGRGGMDIEGAGWKVLEQLLQTGLVQRRGDFFRLSVEDLEGLERFGRKSAENLHASIRKARRRPLERILAGLGIPQVGFTTAIELAAWLADPHEIAYVDRAGVERRETARVSGPCLVWQPRLAELRTTARLEGVPVLEDARLIAESLR